MNENEYMTSAERLRRIGALLSKAVTLHVLAEREVGGALVVKGNTAKVDSVEEDWITRGMMNYMKRFGWATSREMIRFLDIKRSTLFHRLGVLQKRGVVEKREYRGIQYRIHAALAPTGAIEGLAQP